jgi:DtxR family Mn-dependent transcriptional regulator
MASAPQPSPPTSTEENYLKAIYSLAVAVERGVDADIATSEGAVATNAIANRLSTSPASVTDMIKRLNDKGLVTHVPYRGVTLTPAGRSLALQTIRKHRLWETFLVEKLNFAWHEVHDTAEQLEHIDSPELVARLDAFLGHPKFDPHGDPIPGPNGEMQTRPTVRLSALPIGMRAEVASVSLTTPEYLRYLDRLGLRIGVVLSVVEQIAFDQSRLIRLEHAPDQTTPNEVIVTSAVTENVLVAPV